jgi:hypothetical protein
MASNECYIRIMQTGSVGRCKSEKITANVEGKEKGTQRKQRKINKEGYR